MRFDYFLKAVYLDDFCDPIAMIGNPLQLPHTRKLAVRKVTIWSCRTSGTLVLINGKIILFTNLEQIRVQKRPHKVY